MILAMRLRLHESAMFARFGFLGGKSAAVPFGTFATLSAMTRRSAARKTIRRVVGCHEEAAN
jgi:hypothetical protein